MHELRLVSRVAEGPAASDAPFALQSVHDITAYV
jgi:hypothetical protein